MLEVFAQMFEECVEMYGEFDAMMPFFEMCEERFGEDYDDMEEFLDFMDDLLFDPDDDWEECEDDEEA